VVQRLFILLAVLLVVGGSVSIASAQDASPEADQGSGGTLGEAVPYVDDDGDEIAVATVVDVIDPFEDFDEFFNPEEDVRYVAVELSVESTGDDVEVQSYDFSLHTADGFLFSRAFVSRPDAAQPAELEDTDLEEGESVEGAVFFAVPEEAELNALFWQPESGRLIQLADFSAEAER